MNDAPLSQSAALRPMALRRSIRAVAASDEGSATAEYVIATMAAVGFAGLLVFILKGDEVKGILTELVRTALSFAG